MSDIQPKKTIQIAMITSILFLIASGCAQAPEATSGPAEPITVGRYQIVLEPSGGVLKIDTHGGDTFRLMPMAEDGKYYWDKVGGF